MLKECTQEQRAEWDQAVGKSPDGGLLQSWAWGEFQESIGNSVYNLSNEEKTIFAQVFQVKAGNHWILSIPRGPVFLNEQENKKTVKQFFNDLKIFAKEHKCFVIRFDPPILSSQKNLSDQIKLFARKSLKELQPVHTLIIDARIKTEEELFSELKQKWRYNIRLAEKKGITIRRGTSEKDAEIFASLMKKTTGRQDFSSYSETYFKMLITALSKEGKAKFLFAEYKSKPIAGLLLAQNGQMFSYLHGASDYEYRKLMAPHLLQWEAIKEVQKFSSQYDLWGVATDPPSNKDEEHWGGVTRFKRGFSPATELTEYIGAYEIPVSKFWYALYQLRAKLKK